MPLDAVRVSAAIGANISLTPALGSAKFDILASAAVAFSTGTGANQADRMYTASGTINASTTLSIDLAGSLLQPDGSAFTPARVKAIMIRNTHATQTLTVSRPAANGVPWLPAASDAIPVPAGGVLLLAAPGAAGLSAVTAATGDLIDLVNGAGSSVTYEVVIVGASA